MWSWELCQADVLQHVSGVEEQQVGRNETALRAPSLQSFPLRVPHCNGISHTGLETLPTSKLNLPLAQAPLSGTQNFCNVFKTKQPPTLKAVHAFSRTPSSTAPLPK